MSSQTSPYRCGVHTTSRTACSASSAQLADRRQPHRVTWSSARQARLRQRSIQTMPPTKSAKRRVTFPVMCPIIRTCETEARAADTAGDALSTCGQGRALPLARTEPRARCAAGTRQVSPRSDTQSPQLRDDAISSETSRVCICEYTIASVQLPGAADGQINHVLSTTDLTRQQTAIYIPRDNLTKKETVRLASMVTTSYLRYRMQLSAVCNSITYDPNIQLPSIARLSTEDPTTPPQMFSVRLQVRKRYRAARYIYLHSHGASRALFPQPSTALPPVYKQLR
ncbi:hypothetical protein Bbelb_395020 [Branchiostoma belcheri]|nr:hypothetical protein Bbelb_395020 [Branchiostoma belcheri]